MSRTTTTNHTIPFRLRGFPLLSAGNTFNFLAAAPGLWAHLKVYAEGGENGVHAHPDEDHLFVVLDGEATFVDVDGDLTVVGALEGMMVPRGAAYAFRSTGDGNLVMLRVGAPVDPALADWDDVNPETGIPDDMMRRTTSDGAPAEGRDPAVNKTGALPGVPIPGRFFGE